MNLTTNPYDSSDNDLSHREASGGSVWLWILGAACVLLMLLLPVSFFIGGIIGQLQLYEARAAHQEDRIQGFLDQHPDRFSNISVEWASNGWAYPIGSVRTQDDFDLLDRRLHEMFGDELAEEMMATVQVESD